MAMEPLRILLLYAFGTLTEAKGRVESFNEVYSLAKPVTLGLAFGCVGMTSDKDREEILRLHNEYRANLTKGVTIVKEDGTKEKVLPAAKNMYELEWDCDLEAKAEDAMNMTCKHAARRRYKNYGHTRGKWQVCIKFNKPVEEYGVPGVLGYWWQEGLLFDNVNRRHNEFAAENFVNMASGRNTKIGCAVKKQGQRADVYCLYDLPLREEAIVYEAGNGCKTDADCTTYKNSKCKPSGLCHGVPEPGYKEKSEALETSCLSEKETGMTKEIRNYLLDIHNKFRSSVARGLEPDMLGTFTPKAKKMVKLGYDCYLEKVALRTASACPPVRTDQKVFFWNIHKVSNSKMSNMDAAKEAMITWINEIRHYGIGPQNIFNQFHYWRDSDPYYALYVPTQDYAYMVVEGNDRLGCVIKDCEGEKYVHCFLGFRRTEVMGKKPYEEGMPCTKSSDCTGNVTCFAEEALCSAP
ncbi:SCP-like protein [Ancylostoma caninum]|uniref:SCP-like protein n=1 Tax=Ancylostoma caninum TaxID=29170 RepID=A0A368GUC2_ANCCA|nr:SCP-like protein [Ancylostoma caninum]